MNEPIKDGWYVEYTMFSMSAAMNGEWNPEKVHRKQLTSSNVSDAMREGRTLVESIPEEEHYGKRFPRNASVRFIATLWMPGR